MRKIVSVLFKLQNMKELSSPTAIERNELISVRERQKKGYLATLIFFNESNDCRRLCSLFGLGFISKPSRNSIFRQF